MILVREYTDSTLANFMRLSIATENEMDIVVKKLRTFFEQNGDMNETRV